MLYYTPVLYSQYSHAYTILYSDLIITFQCWKSSKSPAFMRCPTSQPQVSPPSCSRYRQYITSLLKPS